MTRFRHPVLVLLACAAVAAMITAGLLLQGRYDGNGTYCTVAGSPGQTAPDGTCQPVRP
jgi:hypothetical protein